MDPFCYLCFVFVFVILSCLILTALWSPLLCVMFSGVFVTFPYGVLGQVWCYIVSIPDICLLPYLNLQLPVSGVAVGGPVWVSIYWVVCLR